MKNLNFQGIFDELPGTYLILEPNPPHFTILAFNKARAIATMSDSSVLGKDLFEVFSDNPNNPAATGVSRLRDSLMAVLETKKMQTMALQRYDLFNPSTNNYEERYWLPKNIPVLSSDNNMEYIIHSVEDISDEVFLRQREKSIKTEVKRLHDEQTKILESVGDAFVSIDEDWIVKYWNNRAENILSIQRNTIIGKCLWDFVKPECNQKLFQNFNLVVANNNPVFFETFYKPTNVWLQISAYPSNKGMTAFLIDITQRKMAEQVLERSERKYRSLVENISDGILTISEKGVIIDVSSSVKKIVGYEQERILGKNWSEMIHQDDRNRVLSAFQYTIGNADKSRTIEFRIKTSLEGYKWLEGTFHNLLDEDSIKAFALNFRDISEKRLHQEQLLESEAKYRYLFENSPATKLVWTLNNLQIREVNQTAINNFGYTRDEFLGMTVLDIWPVEEHERFMTLLNDLKNGVEPADAEAWPYLKKNGELVYMNVSFHRIEFAHSPAIMVLAINVTE
ncbi:MAG: PAS domain-containing protein, partial [Flavisolibacter sp.]